jgi:cytochrome c oxidase subunit II
MPAALLIALVALVFAALWIAGPWSLPAPISLEGRQYDSHLALTLATLGTAFLLVQSLLVWGIWRHRAARPLRGGAWLEWAWTLVTAAVFFSLAWAGQRLQPTPAAPEAETVRIEVLSQQFAWNFRYPGADGRFGLTSAALINDAAVNPFGLDPADPNSADDVVSSALRVPLGTTVELTLRSRDVIHSLFIRELRLKQDLIPGMTIPIRFRAEQTGTYEIACAELCGLGHHQMRSVLEVLPRADFERWLATEIARRQP